MRLALLTAVFLALATMPATAQVGNDVSQISKRARATYTALLTSARNADIAGLQAIIDKQGSRTELGFGGATTAQQFITDYAVDGEELVVLAELVNLLELPYMRVETPNVTYYVWPYLDRIDLSSMTEADKVAAYQLVGPKDLENFVEFGGWLSYRIIIDVDGTWVSLAAGD